MTGHPLTILLPATTPRIYFGATSTNRFAEWETKKYPERMTPTTKKASLFGSPQPAREQESVRRNQLLFHSSKLGDVKP